MIFRTPDPPSSPPGGNSAADPSAAATTAQHFPDPGTADPGTADPGAGAGPTPDWEFIHEIERIVAGHHHNPHSILGAHLTDNGVSIRALRPLATSVTAVLPDGSKYPMPHLHQGVFEATLPASVAAVPDYRLEVTYEGDQPSLLQDDPYRYLPTVGELDLYLIGEGRHEELWRALGAHVRHYGVRQQSETGQPGEAGPFGGEVTGASFAVWAPNARGVRVAGDFNIWDGQAHPMRSLGASGVWELFVPGIDAGAKYKFWVCGQDGIWREKADPMAAYAEVPPATASVVFESAYDWGDLAWLTDRAHRQPAASPLSVYEVHLGSWRPGLSYRELAVQLAEYVAGMGFTHVEFLPVAEHPFGGSWGYQVTSYYAPTSRYGNPDDFRFLVDTLHQAGIGVIIDWVPAHFPRDAWALAQFDGTSLYEHADPRLGAHPDWGTLVFNYGRREVRNFLVANAIYWFEEFHIDGLRVDAVASMIYLDYSRKEGEWLPNEFGGRENLDALSFLKEVNATCYKRVPGIMMIAEESTAWGGVSRSTDSGGLGFGFKWNMGWMNDTLEYMKLDPIYRQYHHDELTFSMVYAYSENFILPMSHDEVVHGKGSLVSKMPGDEWRRFAGLRALLGYMWAHPGKQLLFMGSEFGQQSEWSEQTGLDWWVLEYGVHFGVQRLVRDLNAVYRANAALWSQDTVPEGFSWIDPNDAAGNVLSFLRFGKPTPGPDVTGPVLPTLACVANFSAMPHMEYRVGLPRAGRWREVLNTDAAAYGGSGVGNFGVVQAVPEPWNGKPASATIAVPPLGVVWLVPE
ncbi:MAG TPA: 1,4-alpha-glucan branching protein GlgB [Trebonia sp.]|nr:1,4-alpha-glucan branching protein GlgB [Trebonia sp.]